MRTLIKSLFLLIFIFSSSIGFSQMNIDGQTFIGNEWIDYSKVYYKIKVSEDKIYSLTPAVLKVVGIDIDNIQASQLQLWNNGKEVPLYVSDNATIANTKTIEFYGQKNTIALDTFIYSDWKTKLLNKEFSMMNDTAAYFLTVVPLNTIVKRIKDVNPNYNGTLSTKEKYYYQSKKLVFKEGYYAPTFDGDNKFRYSNFFALEGFSKGSTDQSSSIIEIDNVYDDEVLDATLNIRYGKNQSYGRLKIKWNDDQIFQTESYSYFSTIDTNFYLSNEKLSNSNTLSISNTGIDDRHLLASINLSYPRKFEFDNLGYYELRLKEGAKFIEMDGISNSNFNLYAWSHKTGELIKGGIKNGKRVFLFGNTSQNDLIIYDRNTATSKVSEIEKIDFQLPNENDINYLIVTSKKLTNQENGNVILQDYINYRKETDGSSRKIKTIFVEDIYNQFGYGIDRHIYAFKNFNYFLRSQYPNLKFIFLIGKGSEFRDWRTAEIQNKPIEFYIPSYGDYPSDELLFSEADTSSSGYAIGRLPIYEMSQLSTYLNKVKLFEKVETNPYDIESQLWRKSLLHLSGGANLGQQNTIKNYLKQMEYTINTSMLGGIVNTTTKVTTDPIDGTISEKILQAIKKGVSIITFFGHSSPGSWDISIEDPLKWNNHGKNPIVFSLGCYAGNIHTKNFNVGENFVMLEDFGAIAFVASTGSAPLDFQAVYGRDIYSLIGNDLYGATLGEVLSVLKEKYKHITARQVYTLNQQFTLLGDPGLKLFNQDTPDYTPDYTSVKLIPENVSSGDKTFDLVFDTYNLGKNISDSMNVRVVFENVDKKILDTFYYNIQCPNSKSNNTYTIPNKGVNSLGRNKIYVYIDHDNRILEKPLSKGENNNELVNENGTKGYEFFILDNTALPTYPTEFSIVNKIPKLRISTSNAFAKEAKYVVQIDTTELFNSPTKVTQFITSKGGTFELDANITYTPNVVYYWRVSPDSIDPEIGYLWYNSSFIYLPESSEGWNQSHYFQFIKNPYNFVYVDEDRRFKYSPRIRTIELNNGKYVNGFIGYKVDFSSPAESISPWRFMNGGIAVAVLDTLISTHEINSGGKYGSINSTSTGSSRCFGYFTNTPDDRKKIVDFLTNNVKDGYYVSFFSVYNDEFVDLNTDDWAADTLIYGNSINNVLKAQGATLIDEISNHKVIPYNLMYRKNRGLLAEAIGTSIDDVINTKFEYTYFGTEGNMLTVPLGPASKWHSVIWETDTPEILDTTWLSVVGIDDSFYETVLISKTFAKNIDISAIDAKKYPNLKLNYHSKDTGKRTVPQVKYLRIIADMLPDGFINQNLAFVFPDSVQQGEPITFEIGIENKSGIDMDSLLLKYTYIAADNTIYNKYERIAPLKNNLKINYKNTIDSKNLLGNYSFNFEINPDEDQREEIKFNNIGLKNFKVYPDRINPLMNVTFDGIQILDNDIVSPYPLIRIELKDENKYLLLNDPSSIEVTIEYPDLTKRKFTNADPEFKFIKATDGNNNNAVIELSPVFVDGDYFISVQSKDITGNFSGKNSYDSKFRVINKKAVSNVLNYPNPFSTSTRFVFTITGEVPENIRIQIMTLSGKVVKEITENELGTLRIGNNITNYTWNGTDDYGSKLANGVYLYRVSFSNTDGQRHELIEEQNIDNLFSKGYGKLVIIR